jgi:hypothetical protein
LDKAAFDESAMMAPPTGVMAKCLESRIAVVCVVALAGVACTGVKQHADAGAGGAGNPGTGGSGGGATIYDSSAPDLYVSNLPDVGNAERVVGSAPLGDAACAAQTQQAERLPLDLYVMLDSSGSMTDLTASGKSKWDAVRDALKTFIADQGSAGLGVGLQFFPLAKPGVPASCANDRACGTSGPCDFAKGCESVNQLCLTNADCPRGDRCVLLGVCAQEDALCLPVGLSCDGTLQNTCLPLEGYCDKRDVCEAGPYTTPAVEVATLPGASNALAASLTAKQAEGGTPTSAALQGAIAHAQALAKGSGHRVVVVLATDGFPSECLPVTIPDIAKIAATGLAGTPSISTFAIGVFAMEEAAAAQTNLDTIAAAGGTKQSFVINVQQDVTQAFLTALNAVRTAALSCEFKVPAPAAGATLDYYKVNVQYTSGAGQTVTIGNVASKAACNATKGGWYYDVDPATGARPSNISICDTSCTQLRGDAAGRVDVLLGCKTEIIVP